MIRGVRSYMRAHGYFTLQASAYREQGQTPTFIADVNVARWPGPAHQQSARNATRRLGLPFPVGGSDLWFEIGERSTFRPITASDVAAVVREAKNELSEDLQEYGDVPIQPRVYDRIVRTVAIEIDSLGHCTYSDAISIAEGVAQYMTRWYYTALPWTRVYRIVGGVTIDVARFLVERWPPDS